MPIVALVLRALVGRLASAGLTSGITGVAAWWVFGSLVAGGVLAVMAFVIALVIGGGGMTRLGRSSGWSSGGWSGGGGGSWGGGGSGGFSGGGGSFDGGGASGDW